MIVKTYKEIAERNGMGESMAKRYVNYMTTRWANNEECNCLCGYAQEWATRFIDGVEFEASDSEGQAILKENLYQ